MTSRVQYNTKTCQAILQSLIVLMDGNELSYEYFNELTGLHLRTYKEILSDIRNLTEKINLGSFESLEHEVMEKGTLYNTYTYKLVVVTDQEFDYDPLNEEERIKYSLAIIYLKLKNKHYVGYDSLSHYLPNFTNKTFLSCIDKLKEVIAEDLFKDEFKCYIITDFE